MDYTKLLDELSEDQLTRLVTELDNQIESDQEPWSKKAVHLICAAAKNAKVVNDVLITLCGWSLESLLVFSGILPDIQSIRYDNEFIPCSALSNADSCSSSLCFPCEVNLNTFEVRLDSKLLKQLEDGSISPQDISVESEDMDLVFPNICPKSERDSHNSYLWYDVAEDCISKEIA